MCKSVTQLKYIFTNLQATEDLSKTQVGQGAQKIKEGVSSAAKFAAESETIKKVQTKIKDIAEGGGEAPSTLYKPPSLL